jgi:hypothetical protein
MIGQGGIVEPILLVHGYSTDADSELDRRSVAQMYGRLPGWLKEEYGQDTVFELDVSRYISLEDGIGIDDISRAFDNALRQDFPQLRRGTFHVVIHSTGALVVRNWIRKFATAHQPIRNLVYLAGANFGSGWAHLGKGQIARWGRQIWSHTEAGIKVLSSLELGSDETIDMHLHFVQPGQGMLEDYGVREYVIIGTQPKTGLLSAPVRYAKEDGSDGVIRVSASNLNFLWVKYTANPLGLKQSARDIIGDTATERLPESADYYHVEPQNASIPDLGNRPVVPLAIPWDTAHTGNDKGVVDGHDNRTRIEPVLKAALETRNKTQWTSRVPLFAATTREAFRLAGEPNRGFKGLFREKGWQRTGQYEPHSQIIVRVRDQDGRPVDDYDVNFGRGPNSKSIVDIGDLIEHKHRNQRAPNILTFYLRTGKWDDVAKTFYRRDDNGNELDTFYNRVSEIDEVVLEVVGEERQTRDIQYLPFRKLIHTPDLLKWIQPHCTTIMDIEMHRVPSKSVFAMFKD